MKLILISSFFWFTLLGAQFKDRSSPEKLYFSSDHNDFYAKRLFEVSKFCQVFLNKSLGKLPNNAKSVYIQLEGLPPVNNSWRIIYFKRSELQVMNSYEILHRITDKLLQRHIITLSINKKNFALFI